MSGSTRVNGIRPAKDELVCLKQAVNILRLVEDLGRDGDFDNTDQVVDVVKSARKLIEEVIEALTAYFAAQGGAT